jgi:hypothetical protein
LPINGKPSAPTIRPVGNFKTESQSADQHIPRRHEIIHKRLCHLWVARIAGANGSTKFAAD